MSDPGSVQSRRLLTAGFLLVGLVTGLGWIAALPPFEGFDETAHYSYVQQLADRGTLPALGRDTLSADVEAYARVLPTRYLDTAPFDRNGGVTYREFSSAPASARTQGALTAARRYAPGSYPNWEAQHPPLYYLVLVPAYRATRAWSWPAQTLLLRALSYLIAMAGLWLGVVANTRYLGRRRAAALAAGCAAWPFLVPMFHSEMGRIANDSLCLLIMAAIWWRLLQTVTRGGRTADFAWLGLLLGLGLATKSLFVAVALALLVFLLTRRAWSGAALTFGLAAAIAAPWYLHVRRTVGIATGTIDHLVLLNHGGFGLIVERFSAGAFVRGVAGAVGTFVWGGTWSLARLPEIWLLPGVALVLASFAGFLLTLRRRRDPADWAAVLLVACMGVGLAGHILVRIGLGGKGVGTPGWYLHMLAAPLGLALVIGMGEISRTRLGRVALGVLTAATLAYFAIVSWTQLALYSGCAVKTGTDKHYAFPDGTSCLWQVGSPSNLGLLAYPGVALPLLFGGLLVAAVLLAWWLRDVALWVKALPPVGFSPGGSRDTAPRSRFSGTARGAPS